MADPFIFINTYTVKPGLEKEYRAAFDEVLALVADQEPKMLYFAYHLAEDGSTATTVQVHADAANMERHLGVVDGHVRAAAEYIDFATMTAHIYGTPTADVLAQMRELAGSGMGVTVSPAVVSFDRLPTTTG